MMGNFKIYTVIAIPLFLREKQSVNKKRADCFVVPPRNDVIIM
jgi:hypothetical protein